jgi:hypothetical protein
MRALPPSSRRTRARRTPQNERVRAQTGEITVIADRRANVNHLACLSLSQLAPWETCVLVLVHRHERLSKNRDVATSPAPQHIKLSYHNPTNFIHTRHLPVLPDAVTRQGVFTSELLTWTQQLRTPNQYTCILNPPGRVYSEEVTIEHS